VASFVSLSAIHPRKSAVSIWFSPRLCASAVRLWSSDHPITRDHPIPNQGLTQKHPRLEHLKTNPGWQVIAELLVEGMDEPELLAFCP
jgi:hypothetical protein